MNPREYSLLRKANEQLKKTAFDNYRELLICVLSETSSLYEKSNRLLGFVRGQRYDLLLKEADSLSEQKYSDMAEHFAMNQIAALIRKYPWDPKVVNTDPETQAISKFDLSERKCTRLNTKLRLYGNFRNPNEYWIEEARNFITYVIGSEPNLNSIFAKCNFGSGASLGIHGNATHLARKILSETWTVTPDALPYIHKAISFNQHLVDLFLPSRGGIRCWDIPAFISGVHHKVRKVKHNKICFVPKTAKTHRAIAVEPLLNGFLQKGVDLDMRLRLKRVGINLEDQSRNQELARQGSISGSEVGAFASIDLESASDSISIELVRLLLPRAWFHLLDDLRSKEYLLGNSVKEYAKFCSMGNGFCFPLETLIFAAVCHSVTKGKPFVDFSVYGDDILVRNDVAPEVLRRLSILGFKANTRKTFLQGPFRESCGGDFFEGVDVRPYTLDYKLDKIENIFKALNLSRRSPIVEGFLEGLRPILLGLIPNRYKFLRPYKGNADSGIDSKADEYLSSPFVRWKKKRFVWTWREFVFSSVVDTTWEKHALREVADVYALLSGSIARKGKVEHTFRRKTRTTIGFKTGGGATSQWLPRTLR